MLPLAAIVPTDYLCSIMEARLLPLATIVPTDYLQGSQPPSLPAPWLEAPAYTQPARPSRARVSRCSVAVGAAPVTTVLGFYLKIGQGDNQQVSN